MVAEPEVLVASVESTSDRNVCPELALWMGWDGTGWDAALPLPGTSSTPGPPQPCSGCTDLFRLWISSSVKSKMLARWWLVLQAEVKSLCHKNKLTPHCLAQGCCPHPADGTPCPGPTSQSEGQELSVPTGGGNLWDWAVPAAAERRGRSTHAGNGILQQELGPLAPRSLLLLELLWQEAANRA